MADAIKSVLFVDYDSLYQSLRQADEAAAERLASRVVGWITAIEQGRLAPADGGIRRRVLMRRCYANPSLLGEKRKNFTGNGFLVVDCPPLEGRERSAADIQMALDTLDALEHPTGYEEFILLSGDSDLSPVLIRLRAHNRQTVVYATSETPTGYKALADGAVEQGPLMALLTASEETGAAETAPRPADARAAPDAPTADRTEIEALARKVSAATNVPLFSPKSYLELFRVLAAEVAENGYHFQTTAEHVAARLTASGRKATRRQIVFIVKGLALKGHVFSNTDTPQRLAEVFREQVLYLIRNAGLELTPRELSIMPAWIIGHVPTSAPPAAEAEAAPPAPTPAPAAPAAPPAVIAMPPPPQPTPPAPAPASAAPPAPTAPAAADTKAVPAQPAAKPAETKPPPRPVEDASAKAGKRKFGKGPPGRSEAMITPQLKPSPFGAIKAGESGKPGQQRNIIPVRPSTPTGAKPNPFAAKPSPMNTGAPKGVGAPQASAPRPGTAMAKPFQPRPVDKPQEKTSVEKAAAERPTPEKSDKPVAADKDAVESTILAAIAQAVDVLVEDSSANKPADDESEDRGQPNPGQKKADELPPPDSDDIGDEIQRIIATYNRDRQQSE
jgi:hypothetical protein